MMIEASRLILAPLGISFFFVLFVPFVAFFIGCSLSALGFVRIGSQPLLSMSR